MTLESKGPYPRQSGLGMRKSGAGEEKDGSRVLGEDEALEREANPLLFDEIEEFTKRGLMHANDPRNPFFISPSPDDEGLPSLTHRKRLISYPQLWTYGKMRNFAAKVVGPNLIQQKYDKIAASFRQYFSEYRRVAGLDIEHRCVLIDDVARNLTEKGYDKFACWKGPAASAAETTDAELAAEEAQADLLNWQEEAVVRRMEWTRQHTGPTTILHHLVLNYHGMVRKAQTLLKSKEALITVDAFHYLGHSLITWVRRVVLDSILLDVELRHVAEKSGSLDVNPTSVYNALLMNKVSPDLIKHFQVVDEERKARIVARSRANRKRKAGQLNDILPKDGESKSPRTTAESGSETGRGSEPEDSEPEGSELEDLELEESKLEESELEEPELEESELEESELEESELEESELEGSESSELEGSESSETELHGSEPLSVESPKSEALKGRRPSVNVDFKEGYQAFMEGGDWNSTRGEGLPEYYRNLIEAALSYACGDDPDRLLANKARKSDATTTVNEAKSMHLNESGKESELDGEDDDVANQLVDKEHAEANSDAEGSPRTYAEIAESCYFKESELQDAFKASDSEAEQDELMTSSEAESFINDDEDDL